MYQHKQGVYIYIKKVFGLVVYPEHGKESGRLFAVTLDTPTNHFISYNKNKVATTTSFFLLQTEPCKRYFQTGRPLLRVSKFKDMK